MQNRSDQIWKTRETTHSTSGNASDRDHTPRRMLANGWPILVRESNHGQIKCVSTLIQLIIHIILFSFRCLALALSLPVGHKPTQPLAKSIDTQTPKKPTFADCESMHYEFIYCLACCVVRSEMRWREGDENENSNSQIQFAKCISENNVVLGADVAHTKLLSDF